MNTKYDIAISFAGEDRHIAEEIASKLIDRGIKVFYDKYEKHSLWGRNLYEHLTTVYKNKSKLCLMIISEYYNQKQWTEVERKAAQARAIEENKEYILPMITDNSDLPPGIRDVHK